MASGSSFNAFRHGLQNRYSQHMPGWHALEGVAVSPHGFDLMPGGHCRTHQLRQQPHG
eukprot:CAMPEP_0204050492 /NCGR_PEP_ID=MMETSP0360-20130528/120468_1 /ASSEMBLY_ACC=CAM_ASM_000342 /TAXON_ID=268821 /ORGANISM="Scrippsiella Hangoei, Strain SHTV-5" /LENGTH=57 /DNA_ID=CAMNT_0050997471 /DNA_START=21 /DNA_END=190 /DNA_ORIENTATION=-